MAEDDTMYSLVKPGSGRESVREKADEAGTCARWSHADAAAAAAFVPCEESRSYGEGDGETPNETVSHTGSTERDENAGPLEGDDNAANRPNALKSNCPASVRTK